MLWANNCRFHFREQRGQHFLPPLACRHCLLCASEWFSWLLPLLSSSTSTRKQSGLVWPASTSQMNAHHYRKISVVCLQISLMKQNNLSPRSLLSLCAALQIVLMAVCLAGHKALTMLRRVCSLSSICAENWTRNSHSSLGQTAPNNLAAIWKEIRFFFFSVCFLIKIKLACL